MASSACLPTAGVPGVGNANGMGYCGKEGNEEQVDATALGCLLDEVVLLESSVEEKLATGAAAVDDLGGWGSREEERAG
eukprot:2103494-Rhodomonas_salina.3